MTDTLPDVNMLPAKKLASSIPDSVERPPVEKMSEMLTQLYKVEVIKRQKVHAREQNKKLKRLEKKTKMLNQSSENRSFSV